MAPGLLPPSTRLGAVHLNAEDPERLSAFYQEALGLSLQGADGGSWRLGAGAEDLLVLHRAAGAGRSRRSAGLYHFCLAVPERAQLGWWLRRLLEQGRPLQGLVDHRMAEAIYLPDPEGNGIELNWDRPRSEWKDFATLVKLGNAPLDTEGLLGLADASPQKALPQGTRVGHVHLHVASLSDCQHFYCEVLGFEQQGAFPGQAIFVSAGGYHHHIAFNVWHGVGAAQAAEGSPGLRHLSLVLPHAQALAEASERLRAAGAEARFEDGTLWTRDPSDNRIHLRA